MRKGGDIEKDTSRRWYKWRGDDSLPNGIIDTRTGQWHANGR